MKIESLTLNSPNPAAQAEFYGKLFGLPIETEANAIHLHIGRTQLRFEKGDAPAKAHYAFDVPENLFEAAAAWLKLRLPILKDERGDWHFRSENWNADMLYFHDADKNVVEFIARHNQATASQIPFSAKSLVSISEVGLVTAHVIETVAILKRKLGLKVWRGAGSESFSAVGDEEGLFIVTLEGRPWRPEIEGAKPSPVRVQIAGLDKSYRFHNLPYVIEAARQVEPIAD